VTAHPACPDAHAAVAARSAFGQRSSRTVGLGDLSSAEDEPTEDELESVDCDADADFGATRCCLINRVSRTRQEAVQQVRETVIYELGLH
jgi:hypothetical protein